MRILARQPSGGMQLGELAASFAALEATATMYPTNKVYVKLDPSYAGLVSGAWFLSGLVDLDSDESDYDIVVDLEMDREECIREELRYREDRRKAIDAAIERYSEEHNVPIDSIQKPDDYNMLTSDRPTWNRSMSYQIGIRRDLGIGDEVPLIGLSKPSMPLPRKSRDRANKYLHENRYRIKPGVPYVIVGNMDLFVAHGIQELPRPAGWEEIIVDESTMDPALIVSLVANTRCESVISAAGRLSSVAWALGKDMVIEATETPETAYWEGIAGRLDCVIDLSSKLSTPESIAERIKLQYNI